MISARVISSITSFLSFLSAGVPSFSYICIPNSSTMGVTVYSPLSFTLASHSTSAITLPKPIAYLHHLSKNPCILAFTLTHQYINLFILSTLPLSLLSPGRQRTKSSFHTAGKILECSISTIAIAIFIVRLLQFFHGIVLGFLLP